MKNEYSKTDIWTMIIILAVLTLIMLFTPQKAYSDDFLEEKKDQVYVHDYGISYTLEDHCRREPLNTDCYEFSNGINNEKYKDKVFEIGRDRREFEFRVRQFEFQAEMQRISLENDRIRSEAMLMMAKAKEREIDAKIKAEEENKAQEAEESAGEDEDADSGAIINVTITED